MAKITDKRRSRRQSLNLKMYASRAVFDKHLEHLSEQGKLQGTKAETLIETYEEIYQAYNHLFDKTDRLLLEIAAEEKEKRIYSQQDE